MPFFAYKGRDGRGQEVQGVLEGADSGAIAGQLFTSGVTPLEIRPSAAPAKAGPGLLALLTTRTVTHGEVLLFARQMYALLKAGVPIMGALKGLQESADNPAFKRVMQEIRESLDSGRELSASLARQPKVFNTFFVNMVRVGEQTGTLEEVFLRLFDHMDFEKYMREQVKAAVRYPLFVVTAMAIAIVIINIWVIPAFAKVYAGFRAELPAITKGLIAFSNFMVAYWPVMLVALVAAVIAFRIYINTTEGRLKWDRFKLGIPIAGKIMLKATLARFARSLALAIRSGVPAVQALTMVAHTVENEHIAGRIDAMREGVERGESILRTATATGVFTPIVLQMVAVGEESGALDDMMGEVADMYQREVEYELKTLSSQIEPILIVALGGMVLVLALGVFLPIWDLGQAALGKK
ncbi:MAG TPA: type II secretion system F family protein, partial [Burkholderiales bacterium]|nr:type II secretion system F family protein [Burkholderiales bacterium]